MPALLNNSTELIFLFHGLITQYATTVRLPMFSSLSPYFLRICTIFIGCLINFLQVFIHIRLDGDKRHKQITTFLSIDINDPQQPLSYKRRQVVILLPQKWRETHSILPQGKSLSKCKNSGKMSLCSSTVFKMCFLLNLFFKHYGTVSTRTPTSTVNLTSNVIIKHFHFYEFWTLKHCDSCAFNPKFMHHQHRKLIFFATHTGKGCYNRCLFCIVLI